MRIAIVQSEPAWADFRQSTDAFDAQLSRIGRGQTDLVLLPEMFATGFQTRSMEADMPADGGCVAERMRVWAAALDAAVCGSVAVSDGRQRHNRLFFVRPDGHTDRYDKRHLFTMGGEAATYAPGTTRTVVPWRGWRILLQVCYDLRFPVFARNFLRTHADAAEADYDLMLVAANWPQARIEAWDVLLRARAIENQCYVAAANRVGTDPFATYDGHSQVVDARGRVVAALNENKPGMLHAELDKEALFRFRRKFPVLADADPLP